LAVKINGNRGVQQKNYVSTKVSKKLHHFNKNSQFKSMM